MVNPERIANLAKSLAIRIDHLSVEAQ